MRKKWIIEGISWIIALLFIDVGLSKLMDNHSFKIQLGASPLLENYVSVIAIPLPVIELAVAIMLLVSRFRKYGMLGAFVLMAVFTGYTIYLLTFADHVPCACGGIFKSMGWKTHLYVNSILTILAIWGIWLVNYDKNEEIGKVPGSNFYKEG